MTEVLDSPTLILTKMWEPMQATTVRRALRLAYKDMARLVDPATYQLYSFEEWAASGADESVPAVRTPMLRIKAPEIAVLNHHTPVRVGVAVFSRRGLLKRDRYTCQYCGAQPPARELVTSYLMPPDKGGAATWTNCVTACTACATRKASGESDMKPRRQPTAPNRDHPRRKATPSLPASWGEFLGEDIA